MKKFNVGIIGMGRIACGFDDPAVLTTAKVFTHAGAYNLHDGFHLSAGFDVSEFVAKEAGAKWGIENVFHGDNLTSMLKSDLDVISICTPDHTHYEFLKKVILLSSAKFIFVEKPVASTLEEIQELIDLADARGVSVLVNFQREFDDKLKSLKKDLDASQLLLSRACYYKGLSHIGSTMLHFIISQVGLPHSVLSFSRSVNKQINEESFDFVLFYEGDFQVVVSTLDKGKNDYNYHIFDIEFLTTDKKIVCNYNSRNITTFNKGSYDYSEVKIIDERNPTYEATSYDQSMLSAVSFIYDCLSNNSILQLDSLKQSYNIRLLIDNIVKSYKQSTKLELKENLWKK